MKKFVLCILIFLLIAYSVAWHIPTNVYIAGGENADIKDYPYQLAILHEEELACGAVLIDANWALTAAHCTYGYDESNFTIRYNTTLVTTGPTTAISEIIQHPEFTYKHEDNDICLLKLATPIVCENCKPIALSKTRPELGADVTLTGWGRLYEFDIHWYTEHLQVVTIPVSDQDECIEYYKTISEPSDIRDSMFCAGLKEGGKDSCVGDSGGPAVVDGVLTGIVSFGEGCARVGVPGVYTNVASFIDWIHNHTGIEIQ